MTQEQNETNEQTLLTQEQVTEVISQKQGKSEIGKFVNPPMPPGENSRFLRYALASWDLPPIDISDPQQVKDRLRMYFEHCEQNDRKPQIVGMCNWLGISRGTLNEWVNGKIRGSTHLDIIKRACSYIEEQWADNMQNGRVNPAAGIFLAKNWFGYRDQTDVVVTPHNPYDQTSEQERTQKYLTGMVDENEK